MLVINGCGAGVATNVVKAALGSDRMLKEFALWVERFRSAKFAHDLPNVFRGCVD